MVMEFSKLKIRIYSFIACMYVRPYACVCVCIFLLLWVLLFSHLGIGYFILFHSLKVNMNRYIQQYLENDWIYWLQNSHIPFSVLTHPHPHPPFLCWSLDLCFSFAPSHSVKWKSQQNKNRKKEITPWIIVFICKWWNSSKPKRFI